MMLSTLATYLQTNGIGTKATDLFYEKMPDQPDNAVCLYEYAGSPPEFDMHGQAYENPGLQVIARSKNYTTARTKIQQVVNLLSGLSNAQIGGEDYFLIKAIQSPFPLGRDGIDRHRLAVNFEVMRRN